MTAKFKKGQTWQIGTSQIEIQKVYPPGHKYGANIGSSQYFYLVWCEDSGQDIWNEGILAQIIQEEGGKLVSALTNHPPILAAKHQEIINFTNEIEL